MAGLIGGFVLIGIAFAIGGFLNKREFGEAFEKPWKNK